MSLFPQSLGGVLRVRRFIWAILLGLAVQFGHYLSAEESVVPQPDPFTSRALPILKQHCLRCHSTDDPNGDVDFTKFSDSKSALEKRKVWETAIRLIERGEMPPKDEPRPPTEELTALAGALDATLKNYDCTGEIPAGRVTIRRLNRTEYNNTIRDLTTVDFRPADSFPVDDSGYGFDTIGDVLSLPPILFEKYLLAAEQVVEKALRRKPDENGPSKEIEAQKMKYVGPGEMVKHGTVWVVLTSNSELQVEEEIAEDGLYKFSTKCFGDQAGGEFPKLAYKVDGETVAVVDVKAPSFKMTGWVGAKVPLTKGKHTLAMAFINDYYKPDDPDPTNRDRNIGLRALDLQGPIDETPASGRALLLTREPNDSPDDQSVCAREMLAKFLPRAFRRPVSDTEVNRYLTVYLRAREQGDDYEGGIRLALQAVLISPDFLFKVEADRSEGGKIKQWPLSDHELATRLSYFLWSTMPDDELRTLADRGELSRPEVLEQQIHRMLQDPKGDALAENFVGQWLELRKVETLQPDPKIFSKFDPDLRKAMRQETELLFRNILTENRSVTDLLDANYTFVNKRLADHYGIPDIKGDEFIRVNYPDDRRGGILTHASILMLTSNPTRTSPVKRGKWILENLLNEPPPPPPPNVEALQEDEKAVSSGSLRQRLEIHRAKAVCASCHDRMDPLGFGLENFDGIGAWRDKDGDFPIDPSGELPDGEKFSTPAELRKILVGQKEKFLRCAAEKLLTYALGRGVESSDQCALDNICRATAEDDYRLSRLILEVVRSVPFTHRAAPAKGAE